MGPVHLFRRAQKRICQVWFTCSPSLRARAHVTMHTGKTEGESGGGKTQVSAVGISVTSGTLKNTIPHTNKSDPQYDWSENGKTPLRTMEYFAQVSRRIVIGTRSVLIPGRDINPCDANGLKSSSSPCKTVGWVVGCFSVHPG